MNIILKNYNVNSINTFQVRVAKYWNKIPDDIKVSSDTVDAFKIKLESFKKNKFCQLGNYWELSDEILNRINDSNRTDYVSYMNENPYIAKRRHINIF